MCDLYVSPGQACNRSFRPPAAHVGEYTRHGRVGILFRCCRTSLVLLLVGGLRLRGVKKACGTDTKGLLPESESVLAVCL